MKLFGYSAGVKCALFYVKFCTAVQKRARLIFSYVELSLLYKFVEKNEKTIRYAD